MATQVEIEAAVSTEMNRFTAEFMGRSPVGVSTYFIRDLIVVRFQGILSVAERLLIEKRGDDSGRVLIKTLRAELTAVAQPLMKAMILRICGVPVLSFHHDTNVETGEQVVVFILSAMPTVTPGRAT